VPHTTEIPSKVIELEQAIHFETKALHQHVKRHRTTNLEATIAYINYGTTPAAPTPDIALCSKQVIGELRKLSRKAREGSTLLLGYATLRAPIKVDTFVRVSAENSKFHVLSFGVGVASTNKSMLSLLPA